MLNYINYTIKFLGKEYHVSESVTRNLTDQKLQSIKNRFFLSSHKKLANLKVFNNKKKSENDMKEREKWLVGNGIIYKH